MIAEKTITICGKEVQMRYCAASETGYEMLSGKSSDVFAPTIVEKNDKGEIVKMEPPKATFDDYIKLAIASIIATYERNEQEVPITATLLLPVLPGVSEPAHADPIEISASVNKVNSFFILFCF